MLHLTFLNKTTHKHVNNICFSFCWYVFEVMFLQPLKSRMKCVVDETFDIYVQA